MNDTKVKLLQLLYYDYYLLWFTNVVELLLNFNLALNVII